MTAGWHGQTCLPVSCDYHSTHKHIHRPPAPYKEGSSMSSASPLAYYTAEKDQTRLPPTLTAVAITGIVLCALAIVGQMFAEPSRPSQVNPSQTSEFSIGFAFGRLISVAFTGLMLVGCCGLLSFRPFARIMGIVAAYSWVVLGIF